MAGRRRTIDRKAQRADYDEETEKTEEEETEEDEEEEEDEEGEEEGEGEADVEADADAEDEGGDDDDDIGDDDDEDAPKKKKKKAKKAPAVKRVRAPKKAARRQAVWVIFDNSNKQIDTFPFNEKEAAEKLLAEKAEDKKGLYLQLVKIPYDDKEK